MIKTQVDPEVSDLWTSQMEMMPSVQKMQWTERQVINL